MLLTESLRTWATYHGYDHHVHLLSHRYKNTDHFKSLTYDECSNITISNLAGNNHAKFFSFIKSLEALESNEYDYVCMLDADIGYFDKDKNISHYLEQIDAFDKHIIMGIDCVDPKNFYGGKYPNGGVYLFKNTDWVKRFLEGLIIANKKVGWSTLTVTDSMVDQMQMSYIAMVCPECDEKFLITNGADNIQHWFSPNGAYVEHDKQDKNALFLHFSGPRKQYIEEYFKELEKINEVINYDYNDVIKKLIYH